MFSCMINLLVVVQRCPAVPTAPNTAAFSAIVKSASSVIIIALLPPSSNNDFPNLDATATPTDRPILVDPVAETSAIRLSFAINSPICLSPFIRDITPSGMLFSFNTFFMIS